MFFFKEIFENVLKNFTHNWVFRPNRENLAQGFLIFLKNRLKYSLFCIFSWEFFLKFSKFSGVRGALPLRGRTPKMFPPPEPKSWRHRWLHPLFVRTVQDYYHNLFGQLLLRWCQLADSLCLGIHQWFFWLFFEWWWSRANSKCHMSMQLIIPTISCDQGRSQGGERGEIPPPPETEKIVVEKWCYFRELYF